MRRRGWDEVVVVAENTNEQTQTRDEFLDELAAGELNKPVGAGLSGWWRST